MKRERVNVGRGQGMKGGETRGEIPLVSGCGCRIVCMQEAIC